MKVANVTIIVRGQAGETIRCTWDGDGRLQHGDPEALDKTMHGLELERPDAAPKKKAPPANTKAATPAPAAKPAPTPAPPADEK